MASGRGRNGGSGSGGSGDSSGNSERWGLKRVALGKNRGLVRVVHNEHGESN